MDTAGDSRLRRPELIAALSLGLDLGLGQPTEHVLRTCLISMRLGERIGAPPADLEAAYHIALLSAVGCTADSSDLAEFFGDDNAFRGAAYRVDLAGLPLFGFMLRHAGAGGSPWHRMRMAAALVAEGSSGPAESMAAHCDVAATLAERLGLGPGLREPLRQLFARWDGKGFPRLKGDEIALPVRLVQLADIVEAHRSAGGREAALHVARKRAGGHFDPTLVGELERHVDDLFAGLDGVTTWDEVVAAEPTPTGPIADDELDEALTSRRTSVGTRAASRRSPPTRRRGSGCPMPTSSPYGARASSTTWGAPASRTRSGTSRARSRTPNGSVCDSTRTTRSERWPARRRWRGSGQSPARTTSDSTAPATTEVFGARPSRCLPGCSPPPTRTTR